MYVDIAFFNVCMGISQLIIYANVDQLLTVDTLAVVRGPLVITSPVSGTMKKLSNPDTGSTVTIL